MTIVNLTEKYRLAIDSLECTLQRLHVVDPTKSPVFDSTKHSAEIRKEWKDDKHFGARASGISAALEYVIIQEAGNDTEMGLHEYFKAVNDLSNKMEAAIRASLPRGGIR